MCGIVSFFSSRKLEIQWLLFGLRRLEYRGYDSSGIAYLQENSQNFEIIKSSGKIANLEKLLVELNSDKDESYIGIGHTRWATHGKSTTQNSHPIQYDNVIIVHNGIIDNYDALKAEYELENKLQTCVDTEIIAYFISHFIKEGNSEIKSVYKTSQLLKGSFSFIVTFTHNPKLMIAMRHRSPLILGYGQDSNMILSDIAALNSSISHFSYLEDGDIVIVESGKDIRILNEQQEVLRKKIEFTDNVFEQPTKMGYSSFMRKEIAEQPRIVACILDKFIEADNSRNIDFDMLKDINFADVNHILIISCGTSYYAAQLAKSWIEEYTDIVVQTEISSEARYSNASRKHIDLVIGISQSGETADTLFAIDEIKKYDIPLISLVNVTSTSLARKSDIVIPIMAGPEIGVASTKAFMAQITILLLLTSYIENALGKSFTNKSLWNEDLHMDIQKLPQYISQSIDIGMSQLSRISDHIISSKSFFVIGRSWSYPIALEGTLKLKELSYLPGEAILSGELKHGSLALIEENVLSILIEPQNALCDKTVNAVKEITARNGDVISIITEENLHKFQQDSLYSIVLPSVSDILKSFLQLPILQLIACNTAEKLGNDVDQPRNLAKSVTVE